MTAAGHADVINGFAWNYFSDTWNLAAVLASIQGDVTPESITDAFRATKDLDSFMGPSITCDHTAWPGESACGNRVLLYKVEEGGSQKAITPHFIDTSPYIAVLGECEPRDGTNVTIYAVLLIVGLGLGAVYAALALGLVVI